MKKKQRYAIVSLLLLTSLASHSNAALLTDEECNESLKRLSGLATKEEFKEVTHLAMSGAFTSVLRYLVGRDSMVTDLIQSHGETPASVALDDVKAALDDDQRSYWSGYITYHEALNDPLVTKYLKQKNPLAKASSRFVACAFDTVFTGDGKVIQTAKGLAKLSHRAGTFGHFKVKVDDCRISQNVGTGSRYTEPDHWPGSKFVVIDATFKNIDAEGRLPSEGHLVIKQPNGTTLVYDSTEAVMAKGYGIYFKSVNPLVTMPTKIVYRIPDDVTGEILWQPGRSTGGKNLWCSFLNQGK